MTRRYDPRNPNRPRAPARPKRRKEGVLAAFDPDQFQQTIEGLGLEFRWSRATECPCRMAGSDQWKPDCSLCAGDGWWYIHPETEVLRERTVDWIQVQATFGVMGQGLNWDLYQPFGGLDAGHAIMSMQSVARVGFRDRFVGMDQVMARSERMVMGSRGGENTDEFTVPVGKTGRASAAQKTATRYEPLRVNFAATESGGVVTRYYEGSDYLLREATLAEPARIVWKAGQGPTEDAVYTLHYDCHPVWVVDSATYGIQGLQGPDSGSKGTFKPQVLPTTFEVKLDFLTIQSGT